MNLVSQYLEPGLVERLNQLQLSARSVVEGSTVGLHRSPVKGASIEFRQHRFYVPGDEPRRLDWRVLGRTDRPYIKEYDEETNLRCLLMLDCSGSMAYAGASVSKFDYAARIIASLSYLMLGQTESVGLALMRGKLESWTAPHGGTPQLSRIIDVLERAVPRAESALDRCIHEAADRIERRSLVIIVSDLFTSAARLREGLAHLRHNRHEVILFQVLDPDEISFPFKTWSRFRGIEGERPMICEPAMIRKIYLDNFQRHQDAIRESCRVLRAEFQQMTTDRDVLETLTRFLGKRQARTGLRLPPAERG